MENAGLYRKFDVRRRDGRDALGGDREGAAYVVLDVVHDAENAAAALRGYADQCRATLPEFAAALDALVAELESGTPGPCVEALRTPRPTGGGG